MDLGGQPRALLAPGLLGWGSGIPDVAGFRRPGNGAGLLDRLDRLEDLFEPGDAGTADRASGDDHAYIDKDGVRNVCREVELLEGVVRLEDHDFRTEGQRGSDRSGVISRPEDCLDPGLGTEILGDAFTEQRVLIEDHNFVLHFTCHQSPLPRWHVIRTALDVSEARDR